MASIASALRRIKEDLPGELSALRVHELCRDVGHRWRDRVLDPVTTLRVLMLQVLCGNAACEALPHLSGLVFSGAAYCAARARLSLEVIRGVALGVAQRLS